MTRAHRIVLASSLIGVAACKPIENKLVPMWQPSVLERLGCDGTADAAAAPEDRPVAVCQTSRRELSPIYEATDLIGHDSFDPNGDEIIDYHWKLVEAPVGSVQGLAGTGADRYSFVPQLAGTYVAELVVTNDQCISSDPCEVTVQAVPAQDLWVELSWSHDGDDMDLHLVNNHGQMESLQDCYFGNCTPDGGGPNWGDPSERLDDPTLDLDDIDGTGPENINIFEPAGGEYTVVVHDYPGSVYRGDNHVTVRIHLDGELVYDQTKTISGEDRYVNFALIYWPAAEVMPL